MSNNFSVGQKVVCVDDAPRDYPICEVTRGHVYTIKAINSSRRSVLLHEINSNTKYGDFYADRFRPAVERKADISVFLKMLEPSDKEGVSA
jgi:hypothetical protein